MLAVTERGEPVSLYVQKETHMRPYLTLLLLLITCSACDKKPDTLIDSGYDEQEMEDAVTRARSEVDSFIAELSSPTGEDHAAKAPIVDDGKTEHFWLTDVAYRNGAFEGTVNNDPGIVKNVRVGQKWTVKKAEISDWMFMRDDKIHGNYTVRPLLKTMPEDEAAKWRSMLAEP
jgi:uncharacterized protein YegJ (DUF2314 family)